MKFIENNNTLVVLGSWNISIFSADWIKKYIFDNEKEVAIELSLNNLAPLRLTVGKIQIYLSPNRLAINSLDKEDSNFNEIQEIAIKLADNLPHTPVNAFGINFLIETDKKSSVLKKSNLPFVNNLEEDGIVDYQLRYTINKGQPGQTTLTITESETSLIFDVNYNFKIENLADLRRVLSSDNNNITDYKKKTETIINDHILIDEAE